MGSLLIDGVVECPNRDLIVFPTARRTYLEMHHRAMSIAKALMANGIQPRDRVGVLMPNCMEYAELYFGIAYAGATIVPLNARFKARELAHVISHSRVKAIFTNDIVDQFTNYTELLHEAVPGLNQSTTGLGLELDQYPNLEFCVLFGTNNVAGFLSGNKFEASAEMISDEEVHHRLAGVSVRNTAVMFYTSGTTAMPKACPLAHEILMRQGLVSAQIMKMTGEDRYLLPLPMFHSSATQTLFTVLNCKGTWLSITHFEPSQLLKMLQDERVTAMFAAFPTITQALLNSPDYTPESFRYLRLIFNVAPTETLRKMQNQMPYTTQIGGYGMTETAGSLSMNLPEASLESRVSNQGPAYPGIDIRIIDPDTGNEVEHDIRGEIVVRGSSIFDGYDGVDPADIGVDANGWFKTGDLGAVDADGCLRFLGRLKDMLKVGGENVAAVEVEGFLTTHPAVSIAAVVGVPDEKYVEVVAAFIQLNPGMHATEQEIIDFCKGNIASYKIPRYVRFVDEWPMSSTKIQKFHLRDSICNELGFDH